MEAADALSALVGAVDDDPYWDLVSAVDFLPALDPAPPPAAVQGIDAFVVGAVARL